jgi:hypothetical protein
VTSNRRLLKVIIWLKIRLYDVESWSFSDLSNVIYQRLFNVNITSKYNVIIKYQQGPVLVEFWSFSDLSNVIFRLLFHVKKTLQIWVVWTSKTMSERRYFGQETTLKRRLLDVFVLLGLNTNSSCIQNMRAIQLNLKGLKSGRDI